MKRSACFEYLPSPEYSEPDYTELKKRLRTEESKNAFIMTIGDSLFETIDPLSNSRNYQKLTVNENKGLIVIFFGIMNSYLGSINFNLETIENSFNVDVIGVSSNLHQNEYNFPVINSTKISKLYNVLDPMGGGVYPRDVIILFDSKGNEKLQIPIIICGRHIHNRPISDVLIDSLDGIGLN